MYKWGLGTGIVLTIAGFIFKDWLVVGIGAGCALIFWVTREN